MRVLRDSRRRWRVPAVGPRFRRKGFEASGGGRAIGQCSREWHRRRTLAEAVLVETFVWTDHAFLRLSQRRLDRLDVEEAVRMNHDERSRNDGKADWLIRAIAPLGARIEAIYDHPVSGDGATVRVVSVWRVEI